jgi:hypothetical protein
MKKGRKKGRPLGAGLAESVAPYDEWGRMTRRPASITQTEVARVVKGVVKAGVEVARVEVDKEGRIVIIANKLRESMNGAESNPWDEVLTRAADEKWVT